MSAELVYLDLEDIIGLYSDALGCTEAQAADLLRDRAGLEGALARPSTYAHYRSADMALQAAVLGHGIAEGQYFVDGNKRIALVALRVSLLLNGFDAVATQEERAWWILDLSEHGPGPEAKIERLAAVLRSVLRSALSP